MKTIKYILFIFVSLLAIPAYPASLEEADSAYASGKYIEAAEIFEVIAKEKGVSAELLANLGDCYARSGDYGHAMLSYRRALLLDPSMKEIKNNMDYVRAKVADNNTTEIKGKKVSVLSESPSFFTTARKVVTDKHLSDTWAVWSIVAFILFLVCVSCYIFSEVVFIKKIGFFGGFGLLVLTVLFIVFSFTGASEMARQREGVLLGYKVPLRAEPYATAKIVSSALTRGTEMSILDSDSIEGDSIIWYKVRLNSNYVGWVRSDEFEPIRAREWLIKD